MDPGKRLRHLRLWIVFSLGILAGAVMMTFFYGQKLDSLYLERDALYYANNQKNKEIRRLREEFDKQAEQHARRSQHSDRIEKVTVEVESEEAFGQEAIKEKVEEILQPFIGKSIHWVSSNPDVLDTMLKERSVQGKNKTELEIRLKYLAFLDTQLKVWVQAREISDKDVSLRDE
jgi:biopolymer transport protein ExbB/TolQ